MAKVATAPNVRILKHFPNKYQGTDFTVKFATDSFSSWCPMTGLPDFGRVEIEYTPDRLCLEVKSLGSYLSSYRAESAFVEQVCNRIAADVFTAVKPLAVKVCIVFTSRGGIQTSITAKKERV